MKIIKEYNVAIRITRQGDQFGYDITNQDGVLLHGIVPEHCHENDAIYAALHGLALANNFSGCLKEAQTP